jgi:hypothetical protein
MDKLKETLQQVMTGYAVRGLNCYSYLTANEDETLFSVITIARVRDERIAEADMIVRLLDDKVIIEEDQNDRPLVDALVAAGIPRQQIILAYAGEAVPKAAEVI